MLGAKSKIDSHRSRERERVRRNAPLGEGVCDPPVWPKRIRRTDDRAMTGMDTGNGATGGHHERRNEGNDDREAHGDGHQPEQRHRTGWDVGKPSEGHFCSCVSHEEGCGLDWP